MRGGGRGGGAERGDVHTFPAREERRRGDKEKRGARRAGEPEREKLGGEKGPKTIQRGGREEGEAEDSGGERGTRDDVVYA